MICLFNYQKLNALNTDRQKKSSQFRRLLQIKRVHVILSHSCNNFNLGKTNNDRKANTKVKVYSHANYITNDYINR